MKPRSVRAQPLDHVAWVGVRALPGPGSESLGNAVLLDALMARQVIRDLRARALRELAGAKQAPDPPPPGPSDGPAVHPRRRSTERGQVAVPTPRTSTQH